MTHPRPMVAPPPDVEVLPLSGGGRLFRPSKPSATVALALFLPGRWQRGELWAVDDADRDIRIALSRAGVAVAAVEYRTSRRQSDHRLLSVCTTADLLADVRECLAAAVRLMPRLPVAAIGYSMGAALAALLISDEAEGSEGGLVPQTRIGSFVALDGGLAPRAKAPTRTRPSTSPLLRCPAADPGFRRLGRKALEAGGRAPKSTLLARFAADADQLRYLLHVSDTWWPVAQVEDIGRLAADAALPGRLRRIAVPLLTVCATDGSEELPRGVRMAEATRSRHHENIRLPEWSHADVISGPGGPHLWGRIAAWVKDITPTAAHHAVTSGSEHQNEIHQDNGQ